mmetsp:Transcript_29727/g.57159  ORF Transcript_29727/g.57159 Transcript_29727/m.57159 type:complete len:723 (-) Transcript_29727:314-2482(-)
MDSQLRGADALAEARRKRIESLKRKQAAEQAEPKPVKRLKPSDLEEAIANELEAEFDAELESSPNPLPSSANLAGATGGTDDDFAQETKGLPEGWLDCPNFGRRLGSLIPCKVPLGQRWDAKVPPSKRFTPEDVMNQLLQQQNKRIGLVIDLTNTRKYYDVNEWEQMNVRHIRIPCTGRDGPPDAKAVNTFVFEVASFEAAMRESRDKLFVLVHCTHGFNRTGAMLCHYACRTMPDMTVAAAVSVFASVRPPGIYKEGYLAQLFQYYHEERPDCVPRPDTPPWKANDSAPLEPPFEAPAGDLFGPDNLDYTQTPLRSPVPIPQLPPGSQPAPPQQWLGARGGAAHGIPPPCNTQDTVEAVGADAPEGTLSHEDLIGELVVGVQQHELQRVVLWALGLSTKSHVFPGSQPVSLASSNMALLETLDYRVTWKADGTRYMLLLMHDGAYLIDRKFTFRRVQMRFPLPSQLKSRNPADKPDRHHVTLMDGEMVVDEDVCSGVATRRYLVYDVACVHQSAAVRSLPFSQRYEIIERDIVQPRKALQMKMDSVPPGSKGKYLFAQEPFRVRRKGFWPLAYARKVLTDFKQQLTHESDGLIFQAAQDPYVPFTCQQLLKWKPADMNSVDFFLSAPPGQPPRIAVGGSGATKLVYQEGAKLIFPPGVDVCDYHGLIIECAWDKLMKAWSFMRTRPDKETPNHISTFEKVWASIEDNITEARLLSHIEGRA